MNPLYDDFPSTVVLDGVEREIVTDFRDWLRFYDMLRDPEGTNAEKVQVMLSFYLDPLPVSAYARAHKPLLSFFRRKDMIFSPFVSECETNPEEDDGETTSQKPLFDYMFDAPYIISGFWQDYELNLMDLRLQMHWWQFGILLDGLSEKTEFKQRVMYRNTNTAGIKDVKERQRIERIQRAIAIPMPAPTDEEMGAMFW